jgi:hypothetical protein
MRERCWFIPEQVLKGKLPYRDFETFYGPPNPFLPAVVYYIGGIGLTPERATRFAYRLILLGAMLCLARRWNSTVASGCTLFAALFLVSLGVAAYVWTGAAGLRPGDESEQAIDPVRVSPPISVGRIGSSRPELRMSGTNQMRPASSARMHQTKWCDRDLRFAANSEPTCSAVAGKMEAKVTASGAGLLACF